MRRGITYHGDGQSARRNPVDHLVDLVCVDAETVEGAWGRQLDVGLGGQVGRVASTMGGLAYYILVEDNDSKTYRREY